MPADEVISPSFLPKQIDSPPLQAERPQKGRITKSEKPDTVPAETPHPSGRKFPFGQWLAGAFWMAICVAAAYLVMGYDFKPGQMGSQRSAWPAKTAVPHSAHRLTALLFLHPRCICTAASIKQLVRVMQQHPRYDLTAVVFTPAGDAKKPEWEEGDYVKSIRAAIPNARIVFDRGGVEARRFGALTSGTVLVYDRAGNEIFRGGITDKRGGEGDNPGLQKLGKTLENGIPVLDIETTPVFGCPIVSPHEEGKS